MTEPKFKLKEEVKVTGYGATFTVEHVKAIGETWYYTVCVKDSCIENWLPENRISKI